LHLRESFFSLAVNIVLSEAIDYPLDEGTKIRHLEQFICSKFLSARGRFGQE
jgi:hypothetical protein